jgi:hypothetical protein
VTTSKCGHEPERVRPATAPAPKAPAAPPPESARMLRGSPGCSARSRLATTVDDSCEKRWSVSSVRIAIKISDGSC